MKNSAISKKEISAIRELYESHGGALSREEEEAVSRALEFAHDIHKNQKRASGESFFDHVLNTAKYCAEFGMDIESIIAGLLHESHEMGGVPYDELEERFGKTIAFLVRKLDEIGEIKYLSTTRNVESLRKFIVFIAEDLRIIMIKFADRLDNLRTLQSLGNAQKIKRIARESIEIYAQLAARLGMGKLAEKMRNMAFEYAYPKEYKATKILLKKKRKSDHRSLEKVFRSLKKILAENDLGHCKVQYRVKSIYSLYKKLKAKNMNIDSIHDVIALRVITENESECYRVLGLIHGTWKPIPGRIKDYIALPKANGYRSLHTSVFIGNGGIAEIQIRTEEMHKFAEYGAASHVSYKNKNIFDWVGQIKDVVGGDEGGDGNIAPKDYLRLLKNDFINDRIFVLTPKGDVIDLPKGATALDFAYNIHTHIGNHAEGAYINDKYSALKTKLESMDLVKIKTNPKSHPTKKWLEFVVTGIARKHINNFLKRSGEA